jgi:hypothetical protein
MDTPQLMSVFDVVGFIASILSLILSLLAIWLSLYFYKASRSSEVETAKLNTEIKHKVQDLATINNDLLSAAIKHLGDSNQRMIEIFKEYNTNIKTIDPHKLNIDSQEVKKDVRESILATISLLESKTGRALSIEVFDILKHDFEFGVILSELLRMQKDEIVNWQNAPNPPEAHTAITKVIRHGAS